MNHAIHSRDCRVTLPDWLTRQPSPTTDHHAMIYRVGNMLCITTFAAGLAEMGRIFIEPVTGPVFAFAGPPMTPEDWQSWWPLLSSMAVSLVGLWGIVQNKLKGGFKVQLDSIEEKLNDLESASEKRRADTKVDMKEFSERLSEIESIVKKDHSVIEAALHKSRMKARAESEGNP